MKKIKEIQISLKSHNLTVATNEEKSKIMIARSAMLKRFSDFSIHENNIAACIKAAIFLAK